VNTALWTLVQEPPALLQYLSVPLPLQHGKQW